MIILDTHSLFWLAEGSSRLGKRARKALDAALKQQGLFVVSISFWEIAMLQEKGRLSLQMDVASWRKSLLENQLQELAVTGDIAIRAAQLENFHGDPADRLIVAAALKHSASLCTADKKILAWKGISAVLDAGK
jgi:PIN domain nuclease of toxin-antitoxin system